MINGNICISKRVGERKEREPIYNTFDLKLRSGGEQGLRPG